ncbi:MAG: hypothetical protein ACYCZK_05405 [Microbacteriaceae bacterium]
MTSEQPDDFADAPETEVLIRRAPRYPAFMGAGALLGIVATLLLTLAFPANGTVTAVQLFGYFLLYGLPAGALLGAVVALLVDRRTSGSPRTATAGKLSVQARQGGLPPQQSGDGADESHSRESTG